MPRKSNPQKSAGARLERNSFRNYLRRELKKLPLGDQNQLRVALAWVDARRSRYDRKVGGLGKQ